MKTLIGPLIQRLQNGDSAALAELVALSAAEVRLFIATYAPTVEMVEQTTREVYAVIKRDVKQAPQSDEAALWVIKQAMTVLGERMNNAEVKSTIARDPLSLVIFQSGLLALAGNFDGKNEAAEKLPRQIPHQPPSLQQLLKRHYGEGMSVANVAQAQGLAPDDIAQSLVSARARLDWSGQAGVIDTADQAFPKIIEDYLSGELTPDVRALLISGVAQDANRAKQFERQVRMHILLATYFTPYSPEAIRELVKSLPTSSQRTQSAIRTPQQKPTQSINRPGPTTRLSNAETTSARRRQIETQPAAENQSEEAAPAPISATQRLMKKASKNWPVVLLGCIIFSAVVVLVAIWSVSGEETVKTAQSPAAGGLNKAAPQGDVRYGVVHLVEGNATIVRQGVTISVQSGEALASGDAFSVTGLGTLGTLIGNQVRLTLGADTTVPEIKKNDQLVLTSTLEKGRLAIDMRTGNQISGLVVMTPHSRVEQIDSGSTVDVLDGYTRVQVNRGNLKISRADGSAPLDVQAGSVALARAGNDPVIEGKNIFVRGINFGNSEVVIEGNSWMSLRQAQGSGLQIGDGNTLSEPLQISGRALDFDMKRMYDTGLIGPDGKVHITQTIPNGEFDAMIWLAGKENVAWKYLSLEINKQTIPMALSNAAAERWRRLGPFRFTVKDQKMHLAVSGLQNNHVAGLAIFSIGEMQGELPPMVVMTAPEPNRESAAAKIELFAKTDKPQDVEKITYYNGDSVIGESNKAPFSFSWDNPPTGAYALSAVVTLRSGASNRSAVVPGVVLDLSQGNGLLREVWRGVQGPTPNAVRRRPAYVKNEPDERDIAQNLNTIPNGSTFAMRLRGFLTPPVDGDYTFMICTDDGSELWLSSSEDPSKRVRLAWQNEYAGINQWDKFPEQTSKPIRLEKDKRYFIEIFLQQNVLGGHMNIAWKRPDGQDERPIPAQYVWPISSDTVVPESVVDTYASRALPVDIPKVATPPINLPVIPEAPAGPVLIGKNANPAKIVHLSQEGNADWIMYGDKSASSHVRKSDGTMSLGVAQPLEGAEIKRYGDNTVNFGWSDGTPTPVKAGSTGGIYISAQDAGISFTAPADPILRELKIWLGAHESKGTFTASLSDNSARPYTDTLASLNGKKNQCYTILYRANKPGQVLTITYKPESANNNNKKDHDKVITLQAVALSEYGDGKRRFITGVNLEGDSVVIDGNQWLGQKEAEMQGLAVRNSRRITEGSEPKPAVDAEMKKLLTTGVAAKTGANLEISQKLPNGRYEIMPYVLETTVNNARLFDLRINDQILSDIGKLDKLHWKAYGPALVTVDVGLLNFVTTGKKGAAQLMGYAVFAPARIAAEQTNAFPLGVPHPVPGTILAANFDRGESGKAFFDTKPANEGGHYRNSPVDIGSLDNTPVIGYLDPGEWLRFTIKAEAGTYDVKIMTARLGPTNPEKDLLAIEIDGEIVGTPAVIKDTQKWDNYEELSLGTVTLGAGIHDLRLIFIGTANAKTLRFIKR
jgi:PA14 domain/Carbohydrate binding module (family 6)/Bacterial Ig domain